LKYHGNYKFEGYFIFEKKILSKFFENYGTFCEFCYLISEERKNKKFGKKFELRVRGGIVA